MFGIDGTRTTARLQAGVPVPRPIAVNAQIDTGCNVTLVSAAVLHSLGIVSHRTTQSTSTAGAWAVRLFMVSLSIVGPTGMGPSLVQPSLEVVELTTPIPNIDVLLGMDVLLQCRLLIDGPARQFTLMF